MSLTASHRPDPGMRKRAAGRHVDSIRPRGFHPFTNLHGIVDRVTGGLENGKRVIILGRADLHLKMKVRSHSHESLAPRSTGSGLILQRSAVLIFAVIDCGTKKLCE